MRNIYIYIFPNAILGICTNQKNRNLRCYMLVLQNFNIAILHRRSLYTFYSIDSRVDEQCVLGG